MNALVPPETRFPSLFLVGKSLARPQSSSTGKRERTAATSSNKQQQEERRDTTNKMSMSGNGFWAALSLALAQLCVPPLSYFQLIPELPPEPLGHFFKALYGLLPPNWIDKGFVHRLLWNPRRIAPDGTVISHLFVHSCYNHLISNALLTIAWGSSVCNYFGAAGCYALFFLGGVVGSLSPRHLLPKSVSSAPEGVKDWIGNVINAIGDIEVRPYCCGSTSAVFSFLGCTAVLTLKDAWGVARYSSARTELQSPGSVLSLFFTLAMALKELELLKDSSNQHGIVTSRFAGHSPHLRGFALGAGVTALSLLLSKETPSKTRGYP